MRTPYARLAALLLALSLAWLLGGCGDDGGDSDTSSSSADDSSESSEPSETESETSSDEPGDEGGGDAALQTFIAGCKTGVDQQISAGKVPESLRADLEAVCDSATGVEQEDVDRITLETCVVVASGTSSLSEDEARTRCEAQLN